MRNWQGAPRNGWQPRTESPPQLGRPRTPPAVRLVVLWAAPLGTRNLHLLPIFNGMSRNYLVFGDIEGLEVHSDRSGIGAV
jgi:hypothetical protein